MPNMSPKKNPMPSQDPHVRNKNYLEVATGYTVEMAQDEAARCLNCKHMPCVSGCPVNVKIPDFIAKIVEGDFEGAYQVISSTNALPAISGRVCPQENQCESKCVRGIKTEPVGIGRLERFVADWHRENVEDKIEKPASNGKKVAVAGSGPSSLTCAADLAKLGYEVTVFEAFHVAGGVLVYGIPEFRLPKAIVAGEVEKLKKLGVNVMTDILIGKTISIDELFDEYGFDAVFVGTGAGLPMFMKIPGEGLAGVYSANEYLTRLNLMKAYDPEYDTPIAKGKLSLSLAAVTWQWTPAVGQSVWVLSMSMSSIVVAWKNCLLVRKKSNTQSRKKSNSRLCATPLQSSKTKRTPVMSAQSVASRWNWANPTLLAVVPPRLSPAANSTCLLTPSSCPWAPAPTP